jgi:hypothetical protein
MTTPSTALQLWLLEALLAASSAEEVEAQQLLRLPEMFPFTLSIGLSDLRRHDGFHLHRQGLDMDMVSVRPVKIETTAKPPRKKPARKPQQVAPTLFHEANGEPPKKPALPPIIPTIEAVAVAERPIDRPPAKPELIGVSLVAEEVAAAEPEQPGDQAPVGQDRRADRLATAEGLELPHEMPFRAPISECLCLSHEGLDFACIALAHDTIDAILRLVCRVKLGPRQAKCADIRSQLGGLSAIGVLPTALKTRLEKLWYERVDYLELNTAEDLDRSALEGAASSHISTLLELVQLFFGHSSAQGKVVPDHAEYWNLGKQKLPFKAGTVV